VPFEHRVSVRQSTEGGFDLGSLSKMESIKVSSLKKRFVKKAKPLFPKPKAPSKPNEEPTPSRRCKYHSKPCLSFRASQFNAAEGTMHEGDWQIFQVIVISGFG
jgi:hypothetical protein